MKLMNLGGCGKRGITCSNLNGTFWKPFLDPKSIKLGINDAILARKRALYNQAFHYRKPKDPFVRHVNVSVPPNMDQNTQESITKKNPQWTERSFVALRKKNGEYINSVASPK
jgi:hypothetical protein